MTTKNVFLSLLRAANKKSLTFSAATLGAVLLPVCASHAFVDERTPPAPAAPAPAQVFAVTQTQIQALPQTTGSVSGDLNNSLWNQSYPGPFGTMRLADALIAHIVPVSGGAIHFAGAVSLLDKSVDVVKVAQASRLDSLARIAQISGVSVAVHGATVTLAGDGQVVQEPVVAQAAPVAEVVLPVVPVGRTWNIAEGVMLSSAVLEWAKEWGWNLIWQADVDYRISAPIVLTGEFLDTVGQVLDAYKTSPRPLWGDWNSEQQVLVVREPTQAKN